MFQSFAIVCASFSIPDFKKQIDRFAENTLHFYPSLVTFEQLRAAATTFRAHRALDFRSHNLEAKPSAPNPNQQLHAQKLIVQPSSTVLFFGDLHGNIHSLIRSLNQCVDQGFLDKNLKLIKPNTYMVFLGDYVDRGFYSTEVLYTLLTLANSNPNNVILLRGNHEDEIMNATFGFKQEIKVKFSNVAQTDLQHIFKVFDAMPSVLYLGCGDKHHADFIQCCHGGLEIGFNPHALFNNPAIRAYQAIDKLERTMPIRLLNHALKQEVIAALPSSEVCDCSIHRPTQPVHLGLLWNDFIEKNENYKSSIVNFHENRGWVIGEKLTKHILSTHSTPHAKLHAIFRAHQHHGTMRSMLEHNKGIVPLWDGLVYTFVSALNLVGAQFQDSFGILTTAPHFKDWHLQHCILNDQMPITKSVALQKNPY